jgi:ATP-binding cassette subfamily B protein
MSSAERPAVGSSEHPSEPPRNSGMRGNREEALRRFHDEDDVERVYDLRMLAALWPFCRPHGAYLLGSIVLLVVMAGLALLQPIVMREFLNAMQAPDARAQLARFGVILAGLFLVEQVLSFPQMYWVQIAGARAMADLRRHVFRFLHTRSLSFFDRTPLGRLVTRVTNDVDAMGEMFASGALNAVGDLIRLVAIVVIMMSLDWRMSLFAFASVPPIALFVNWTRRRMRNAYREVRTKTARMNAYINEQVSGIAVVQAYAREERSELEFDAINSAYRGANTRAIILDAALDASIEMVGSICVAAILWYAGARSVSPEVTFGTLFAFVRYLDMFFWPVRNLSARYTQIQSALAGAERVFQLLATEEEDAATDAPSGESDEWPSDDDVALELQGVTFGYKPGVPVLHDLSLEVKRGETIALVGPTGSGKTTIASLLLRLYEVSEGGVQVLGREVRELERGRLRRQFAVVPQDVFLFPGSIAANVAAGEPGEPDHERVREILERLGALDLFERRDDGLETKVLERGSNFSAGERQLIAFARALYRNPPIMILDEPTANIDSDTESRLQRALEVTLEGRTALIIAHRLSTVRSADRVIVLHHGRVVEQGTHDELLAHNGVYAKLYRLQDARRAIAERIGEADEG